jgi:hypothetical protein
LAVPSGDDINRVISVLELAGIAGPLIDGILVLEGAAYTPEGGDAELVAGAYRRACSGSNTCDNVTCPCLTRDDVGDDLNLIVLLLMARLERGGEPAVDDAIATYRGRSLSYGSYFKAYCDAYYNQANGQRDRSLANAIQDGIDEGWTPDVPGPYGAVRWYHRWAGGGNPKLATMYEPIIATLIMNAPTTTSTTTTTMPTATVCGPGEIDNPTVNGMPLDDCLTFAYGCGQLAADAYCASVGCSSAGTFALDPTCLPMTYVIGDGSSCSAPNCCQSFASITCARGLGR